MKTRSFLLLALLPFLTSCMVKHRVSYDTRKVMVDPALSPLDYIVYIKPFQDIRKDEIENHPYFNKPRTTRINNKDVCINAEKGYPKDSIAVDMARAMAAHFNQAKLFRMTVGGPSTYIQHYITGKLVYYQGTQKYSYGAMVGAQFGLLGALATAGIQSAGKIRIKLTDLALYTSKGELVAEFGDLEHEKEGDLPVDSACMKIYQNVDNAFMEFNDLLVEKIRAKLQ